MTAIAAAKKKKEKDDMYYAFNTSRGMGYLKTRRREYSQAARLYTKAIENAEPGLEVPLLIARSKAHTKLVDYETARTDALQVLEKSPDDIRAHENDAYTLYEKDDFEEALVRNYCGLHKRKKPDYFYKGILIGKETIEDCIGRNAGPCLDHDRLGRIIVDLHMNPKRKSTDTDALSVARRKKEKEQIDKYFSQIYLRRQAADKQFLIDFLKLPDLKSGNKENNKKLKELISKELDLVNRQQETLMTQRPLYMLKHHEPKFSKKYKEQKKEGNNRSRKGVMKVIDKLLEDAERSRVAGEVESCMFVCTRLRRFIECQPRNLLSDTAKDEVLDKLYNIVGTLFMDTKSYVQDWSDQDNEKRMEFILCSQLDNPRFVDRCIKTYFPKIWNIREMKRTLESRLELSINKLERTFLYHELSRCLIEENSTEKAYKAASAAYKQAKDAKSTLWSFNCGFLTALIVLLEGSVEDAKIGFSEVMINARKLERDDCASFIQKIIRIIVEPGRLNYEGPDPVEQREKEIVKMMVTPELRVKAHSIMRKVTAAPTHAKLQLQPTSLFKTVAQGTSRRSMKITKRAKRRTIYEAKSSRTASHLKSSSVFQKF